MTLDTRALRLLVLGAWTGFLFWLWASDEVLRYLGPRTQWVVPAGAIALALSTLAYARGARRDPAATRPPAGELVGTVALLAPIVVAAVLSGASLGSQAAAQKLSARGVDLGALARLRSGPAGEVTFLDLEAAAHDPELARENDIRPGRPVTLIGFVSGRAAGGSGDFELARFYITCCVADAIPVGVTVKPAPRSGVAPRKDDWLAVTGAIVRDGDAFAVRALRVRPIAQPKHPYLSFST